MRSVPPALPWLAALVLIVLAVFWPTLHSGFVYDSQGEIVLWDWLHEPRNILTAVSFRVMGMDVLDFNRPVAVTYLMFNSLVWGRGPFGYHLDSVLLHAATACLVFALVRHLLAQGRPETGSRGRMMAAFLAALLFALHPVVTEAVCEPSNCKDLLATFFTLSAVLLATRHRPGWGPGDPARVLLCPWLGLLAIGSKELGLACPVLLLAYWLIFRRGEPGRFWLLIVAATTLAAVVFLDARFTLEHRPSEIFQVRPVYDGGSLARTAFLVQPRIFAFYLLNLAWPLHLCADYTPYSIRLIPLWFSYVLDFAVAGLLGWWAARDRRALFAVVLIGAALLPVANLVPIYHPVADRFLYAPLLGLAILLALALEAAWRRARPVRFAAACGAVVVVLALLLPVTRARERVWSTPVALWENTLARNPVSVAAHTNLPRALMDAGRWEEARAQSEVTLGNHAISWTWAWFDYAIELEHLGDAAGAESAARKAMAAKSDITDADKMQRTLQMSRERVDEFDRIAARLRDGTPNRNLGAPTP